jgi:hypothetical protein
VQETGAQGLRSSSSITSSTSNYSISSYDTAPSSLERSNSTAGLIPSHKVGHRRSGNVSPSSSISSSSKRSPLSTMRTVENPELAIRPDLRFFSVPSSPPPPQRRQRYLRIPRKRLMPQTHDMQQKSAPFVPQFKVQDLSYPRNSIKDLPSQRGSSSATNLSRLPGPSFMGNLPQNYKPNEGHETAIEAHTLKIEESVRKSFEQKEALRSIEAELVEQLGLTGKKSSMMRSIAPSLQKNDAAEFVSS